ncbi:hypothetical protein RIF29_36331 [Crotalaria pallida]|uniref:Uncharacterized protein n=1 Tax=Crotalaria pallida TaxID=3830 RepID=A0AAN9HUA0_CROPI
MLKRVIHSLGLVDQHTDKKDPRRKSKVRGTSVSPEFSSRSNSKDFVVRIVHEGGEVEVYHHAISAKKLMAKYPGMCVAKPEVFQAPNQSVLLPEERLRLGHKYIIISCGKVEKLKHRHAQQGKKLEAKTTRSPKEHKNKENEKISVGNEVAGQEIVEAKIAISPDGCEIQECCKVKEEKVDVKMKQSQGGGVVEEHFSSAKDFYVSKEKTPRYSRRKGIKGKNPFVPPLPKAKSYRGLGWQPTLPTVKEISP